MQPVQPDVTVALLEAAFVLGLGLLAAFAVERLVVRRYLRPHIESSAGTTHRCRRCRRAMRSFAAAVAAGDDARAERAAARILGRNDALTPHDGC
jgi:hypothetical protein